jgi:shikimate 5-dehydrogenase
MGSAEFSLHEWDFSGAAVTAHASNGVTKGIVTLDPTARLTIRTNNVVDWDAGKVTPVNTDVTVTGVTLSGLDSAAARALLSNGYLEFQLSDGFIFRVAFNGQDGIVP